MAPVTRGGNGAHVRVNEQATTADGIAALRKKPGMLAKVARELGLQRQATSKWTRVPATHVLEVARISRISRSILRPDLYPKRGRD
jgi:hypothetical protein